MNSEDEFNESDDELLSQALDDFETSLNSTASASSNNGSKSDGKTDPPSQNTGM